MNEPENNPSASNQVNPSYLGHQLAKARQAAANQPDLVKEEQATRRASGWVAIIQGILSGNLGIGSRTPVQGLPAWVTLDVRQGGFGTGQALAGAPLADWEVQLLKDQGLTDPGDKARSILNGYFLTQEGMAQLLQRIQSGCYRIGLPEEAALPVAGWLASQDRHQEAVALIESLAPQMSKLRFYPRPTDTPSPESGLFYLQTAGESLRQMEAQQTPVQVIQQRHAVEVARPLYDRLVSLFAQTVIGDLPTLELGKTGPGPDGKFPVQGGWPCRQYPSGWQDRATVLRDEIDVFFKNTQQKRWSAKDRDFFDHLWSVLRKVLADPASLTGREVGKVRQILACYVTKRGNPGTTQWEKVRQPDRLRVAMSGRTEFALALADRLQAYSAWTGIVDLSPLSAPVTPAEAQKRRLLPGAPIPDSLTAKLRRCWAQPLNVLVEQGVVSSSEVLATLAPQIASTVYGAGLPDEMSRRLAVDIYRAFRRRRSLLLVNYQSQVKINELPWFASLTQGRRVDGSTQAMATQALRQVALLNFRHFPATLVPNKLRVELAALATEAGIDLLLVDELAADIFMGGFSAKFIKAAKVAANLMNGTLYARYYGIDYSQIKTWPQPTAPVNGQRDHQDPLAQMCVQRADAAGRRGGVAANGMVIEQQQIITTQNLAQLFAALNLRRGELAADLPSMARRCVVHACDLLGTQKLKLRHIKNAAYAWRHMVFYLSWLNASEHDTFMDWASDHLSGQPEAIKTHLLPALRGVGLAVMGQTLSTTQSQGPAPTQFLGWKGRI